MMRATLFASLLFVGSLAVTVFFLLHSLPELTQAPNTERLLADGLPRAIDLPISNESESPVTKSTFAQIQTALANEHFNKATNLVLDNYSVLNRSQLDDIKQLFLQTAFNLADKKQYQQATRLLGAYVAEFSDKDVWQQLGRVAEQAPNHNLALQAFIEFVSQENSPQIYEAGLRKLERIAGKIKKQHELDSNSSAILTLYRNLYERFPTHNRFIYELALAHLNLGDTHTALNHLQTLIYDFELGNLARQQIDLVLQSQNGGEEPQQQSNARTQIALSRLGSNLLVPVTLQHIDTRLLLDTGASITGFASGLIAQLGLRATGNVIQLNTANGRLTARLFYLPSLKLGPFTFQQLTVAEIELNESGGFSGLLGTDILSNIPHGYEYLIDNSEPALVFIKTPG